MAVPKRKKSKMRIRQRKAHHKFSPAQVQACPNCGAAMQSHRVCTSCGQYRSRQVVTVQVE